VLYIYWTITIGNIFLYYVSLFEVLVFGSYPLEIILKTRLTKDVCYDRLNRPLKSKETGEERTCVSFEERPEHGNSFLTSLCSLIQSGRMKNPLGTNHGRCAGLRTERSGSGPERGHCFVFVGNLLSQRLSLYSAKA